MDERALGVEVVQKEGDARAGLGSQSDDGGESPIRWLTCTISGLAQSKRGLQSLDVALDAADAVGRIPVRHR